ncbi:MAG TPA: integration host factor subunit alpha [bacterium]
MTKADIAEKIYKKMGFTRTIALEIVNEIFEMIKESALRNEIVKISGFGDFITKQKNARRGHNPKTGETLIISARSVFKFKPSQTLKKKFQPPKEF